MNARSWSLALALAPLVGCTDRQDFWRPPNDLLPMAALDDRVAFVERNSQTAFLLDPADPSLTPRAIPVGKTPVTAVKHQGKNELLVLAQGDPGSNAQAEVAAELDVIAALATQAVAYPLTDRFDAIAQSAEGRFAVLYHSPDAATPANSALFNPNAMTLVDFTPPSHPAEPTLTAKTIRSLGGVPAAVVFSPRYGFALGPRTLAVVLSQNYVTLLDLDNPTHSEISLPLCPTSKGCNLMPAQVVFDPDNLALYVRVDGAQDIYQITLTDEYAVTQQPPTAPDNDFVASLSMLAVGGAASDMVLYGAGKHNTRLVVASAQARTLVIIDPSTSRATPVATPIPVTDIVPFVQPAQTGADQPHQQALLVDHASASTSVVFADLEQVESSRGLALEEFPLAGPAAAVAPLVEQGIAVLLASPLGGSAAVTVVDLHSRSFSVWSSGSSLSPAVLEARSPSRLWGAAGATGTGAHTRLCYLNLVARTTEPALTKREISLDQAIVELVPLAAPSSERTSDPTRYLVVRHDDPGNLGNLTVLDAESPTRAGARTGYGFLLNHYLEREQP
jgi:hypothetical protein